MRGSRGQGEAPQVNTRPAPMPTAAPVAAPARRVSRGQQRRANAMQELREGLMLEGRLAKQALLTPEDEAQKQLSRNEMRHFIVTLCTFGLWGPVWLYVLVRNSRRHGRTSQGRLTKQHVKAERARLRSEQKQRRKNDPSFASTLPR